MKTRTDITTAVVVNHFTTRSSRYDQSSYWCTDFGMLAKICDHLAPTPDTLLLDVACGTGLVSRYFRDRVGRIVGVDLTEAMFSQGRPHLDGLVHGSAERLPFRDSTFDLAIERQGIQFMDAEAAVKEMVRTTKPGGRVCLIQLCAYDEEDRDEYFEILRLRNPARKNFFVRQDLAALLTTAGCEKVEVLDHITEEDVDRWADNGAIDGERRSALREIYHRAGPAFHRHHAVRLEEDGRIVDRMLFGIAVGTVAP